ncbi:MAG: fumarate hydratase [Candidatus Syntrophosphaera sp.]
MQTRTIPATLIREAVIDSIGEIYCQPHMQTIDLLQKALKRESDEIARDMLGTILENARVGAETGIPVCQDTGLLIVFARIGVQVQIEEGTLRGIIESAAAEAWKKYYLRDSIAWDPLRGRASSEENGSGLERPSSKEYLPVILHMEQVEGDELRLDICLKGGGAENCSALKMFNPTATIDEIEGFVVDTIVKAGGKPCPPVIVGVGIGGDFELCAQLAKKALVCGREHESGDEKLRNMEHRILDKINQKGRGVQGFAGKTTALEVRILMAPCHIASLPVAVNVECHSHRCASRVL